MNLTSDQGVIDMGTSSKYKSHYCSRCFKKVDNLTALEQEQHIENCLKQTKLGEKIEQTHFKKEDDET